MSEHGRAIMRHQNPTSPFRAFEEFRIGDALQAGFASRGEVNAGLSLADRFDDSVFEIGVRLEAKAQVRGSHFFARTRSSFSQSRGFACCNGMVLFSNSRSVRARYSSISRWWSR